MIEAPIRAESFGAARFEQHGLSLGLAHAVCVRSKRGTPFFPRIADNIRVLREAHAYIGLQEIAGRHISPAGEWLLDNFHVVQAQIKEIHDGLPLRYFRDLPVLAQAHLEGLPRIYGIAWAFVAHTDSAFEPALLTVFLQAYQRSRELNLGELWALPTTLRVVLIENLRRLSERVAAAKAARDIANLWCDQAQDRACEPLPDLLRSMAERGVVRPFALQVLQRVQSETWAPFDRSVTGRSVSAQAMTLALSQALPDHTAAQLAQQAEDAADNLSVCNAITALRSIGDADWRDIVVHTSLLMQQMTASAVFQAERDDTQDSTLHAIEQLAQRSGQSERSVATALIELMTTPPEWSTSAPSHWLRGPGCPALRQRLGLPAGGRPSWMPSRQSTWLLAYLGTVVLGALLCALWLLGSAHPDAMWAPHAPWVHWVVGLMALWPASEAVLALLNRVISESITPKRLPRLAFAEGVPAEHRVLIVIPALLSDMGTTEALVAQLERHHLANREDHAQFALLTDFTDASSATTDADVALLAHAVDQVNALQARHEAASGQDHAPPSANRFLLLHRARRWSTTEGMWIGWERKRGKLMELVAQLAGRDGSAFLDLGPLSALRTDIPYLLTLDSDTVLPPGALRALVGVAAHPLNRPKVDTAKRRVTSGHGILQPRIVTPLPTPRQQTPFHWLFAERGGTDPYSAVTSEVYQDLFSEGTFSGKGLLNVAAVHAVLWQTLPEGLVLSHDLIEGCVARCGSVSDVVLIEDEPSRADVSAARLHRWTRGDWQLLPVLLQWRRFPLSAIHRWRVFDNLRRSLLEPMSALLILAALLLDGHLAWVAIALVAAACGAGPLMGAVAGLVPHRKELAWPHFAGAALGELAKALAQTAWRIGLLWFQAVLLLDAMARALYRMVWSHRLLLQWTPSGTPGKAKHAAHAPRTAMVSALLAAGALLWLHTPSPWLTCALLACWSAGPWWMRLASRTWHRAGPPALSTLDRQYLGTVARDTWRLFEQHVGPDTNHLPPDNVQTLPFTMVAERTSPTNIGLYLLSCACAREFGWISLADCLSRCEATLQTLGQLERHRGHFLNWYDTRTLAPLPPAYVSTVDSGNLCGHLLTVASACLAWATDTALLQDGESGEDKVRRLQQVAAHCQALAQEAEFGFLFHPRRRLMHIGYRVVSQELDKGYYDLLASEARLASLWAIAKGDVPVSHWAALGRPFYAIGSDAGLRSWSGSMFEYLMPTLVLDERPDSVLGSAGLSAIHAQMAYAARLGLPWGMSESAYAASDHTLAYQYAPQGVPRLALRRTPPDEWVVAPYASALAAMLTPVLACANLRRLERMQARSVMGFIDALDFTADRQAAGDKVTRVSTYMAHHQGMTIVALAHVLLDAAPSRWGMANAQLASVASLLQERLPRALPVLVDPPASLPNDERRERFTAVTREITPGELALPPTQLLSNGRYSVSLRANGAGWSRFNGIDLTRWRDDALSDAHGSFIYLRRDPQAAPVSLTQHPAPDPQAQYRASFLSDRAHLDALWPDLRTRCTIWVSPEDDIELRHVELWNTSAQAISLELTSAWEVCLSEARADEAHPAFGKLFVQAQWDAADRALYFHKRPRLDTEQGLHAVHFIACADPQLTLVRVETDRAKWMGRHRDACHPLARMDTTLWPTGEGITGLDPMAAMSMQVHVPAHGKVQFTLGTAAALERTTLSNLVDRYQQAALVERSSLMSATLSGIRLREMRLPTEDRVAIRLLTTTLCMLLTRPAPMGDSGPCNRQALWRFGISGDRPLLLVDINDVQGLRMVGSLVQALKLWSWSGLLCDLVVLNAEATSYLMPLRSALNTLSERYLGEARPPEGTPHAGLHLLRSDELSELESTTLHTLARVQLHADGRSLAHHVQDLADWHAHAQAEREAQSRGSPHPGPSALSPTRATRGHFHPGNGTFQFKVNDRYTPPRPWINVLANRTLGAHVSEAGGGYTWAGNSKMHQLTAWSNDPVTDPSGENFFLQNLHTRTVWSVGGGAGRAATDYTVSHGQGSTTIGHRHGELSISATWCVEPQDAVKRVRVEVHNHGPQTTVVRAIGVVEWMMGAQRSDRQSVYTACHALHATESQPFRVDVLTATQQDDHAGFGGNTAFLTLHREGSPDASLADWTCDRRKLFDDTGQRVLPDHLGSAGSGAGLDACAAAAITLNLPAGQSRACVFVIGHATSGERALALAHRSTGEDAQARERASHTHWQSLLGAVNVHTPDPLFDALVNHWLLYQAVACRMWAKSGFYQAGGAFGFRDQLQDAMALSTTAPHLLREQLLVSASRQFPEGDVQHWWHPPRGAGVRTHCSDDLLWLPWATVLYASSTQNEAVWDTAVPFIDGAPVPPHAEDIYNTPTVSAQEASLYEHCARAIDHSLPVGRHGLPLIGTGDWNDGMNQVGPQGQGESVWLACLLITLLDDMAPIAMARGDADRAARWHDAAKQLRAAARSTAWDGDWFVRAFFDDGSPLGSQHNTECRIDLISQAWSVLSDVGSAELQSQAMASVQHHLVDPRMGLVRLLDPPLVHQHPNAGYIQAYPPGVRENGGQYNHAAVWWLMAQARLGHADGAYQTFTGLSPAHRSASSEHGPAYGLEPYVMAGDISSQPPYTGRGGWSWYTGSASWLHRAAIESMCGLQLRGDMACITPCLPTHWGHITLRLRRDGLTHVFVICAAWDKTEIDIVQRSGAAHWPVGEWRPLRSSGAATTSEAGGPAATPTHLVIFGA